MKTYRFIAAEKATFPISFMCSRLGVSRSGYHAWVIRPPSRRAVADASLSREIVRIHESSRRTYGAPRIHAELAFDGHRVGRKRVARLMRRARIQGVHVRRRFRTTKRSRWATPAPDLVLRSFRAPAPDRLWVADVTSVRTNEGWLYLAAIVDCFSRRVVGWSMAGHPRTELVADALEMAISRRRPGQGLVHHSDAGTQYTSLAFGRRLRQAGIAPSMGTVGDALDNAVAESFFGTLKRELVHRHSFHDAGSRQDRAVRLHRGVLQPPAASLDERSAQPRGVREEVRCRFCHVAGTCPPNRGKLTAVARPRLLDPCSGA